MIHVKYHCSLVIITYGNLFLKIIPILAILCSEFVEINPLVLEKFRLTSDGQTDNVISLDAVSFDKQALS